jgi:hypothetical protein
MWEERVKDYIKVLSRHLPGRPEVNEKPQQRYSVSHLRFELVTSEYEDFLPNSRNTSSGPLVNTAWQV